MLLATDVLILFLCRTIPLQLPSIFHKESSFENMNYNSRLYIVLELHAIRMLAIYGVVRCALSSQCQSTPMRMHNTQFTCLNEKRSQTFVYALMTLLKDFNFLAAGVCILCVELYYYIFFNFI